SADHHPCPARSPGSPDAADFGLASHAAALGPAQLGGRRRPRRWPRRGASGEPYTPARGLLHRPTQAAADLGCRAARRGVREASGGAGDIRVEEGAGGEATGKVVLYFLYSSYTPSARACCSPLGLTVRLSWWRNLASDGHRESGCVRSEYRHVTLPTDDTPPS